MEDQTEGGEASAEVTGDSAPDGPAPTEELEPGETN